MIRVIDPKEAGRLVDEENALLVDIREPEEHAGEHIPGARLAPLSVLSTLPPDPDRERPAVFFCQSGMRTKNNAGTLEERGFAASYIIEGGLNGWKNAGLPAVKRDMPLPMPRQIQIGAGSLVFLFSLLAFFFSGFLWLTLLVGLGLIFAGYTGVCMMARVLARMPWNRPKPKDCG